MQAGLHPSGQLESYLRSGIPFRFPSNGIRSSLAGVTAHLDRGERGRYGFGIGEVAEWLKAAVC